MAIRVHGREYCMIHRVPDLSPSCDFTDLASPPPLPLYPARKLSLFSLFLSLPVFRRSSLLMGEGGGGAKLYDSEKAWSSVNHSILSAGPIPCLLCHGLRSPLSCFLPTKAENKKTRRTVSK